MSIEQEIQDLTQSTTDLLNAVNTKKATLDTAVSNAQTAVTDATSQVALAAAEKVGAQTARDEAETHKNQAYTYSQSAASAVAYQDLTAIAQTKAETAVDVFVYDTSKDSDGGAWRKRTQHTSWYNETLNTATRGSRKEFPAVAVIVAETNKVTIYDGDDPSLPMWMVFNQVSAPTAIYDFFRGSRTPSSLSALNGLVCFGTNVSGDTGLHKIDLIADDLSRISVTSSWGGYGQIVSNRNVSMDLPSRVSIAFVNGTVNDVAMTVLPDAPIDQATGLPIPTIAVATDGGVSVIKDDGTVVDSNYPGYVSNVTFSEQGTLGFYPETAKVYLVASDYDADGFNFTENYDENGTLHIFRSGAGTGPIESNFVGETELNLGFFASGNEDEGLYRITRDSNTHLLLEADSKFKNMHSHITSTYNTGWMNGDIKLATLSDTDDTDLVGSELVTNGTFDTDISGWSGDTASNLSVVNGQLVIENGDSTAAYAEYTVNTVVGKTYTFKVELIAKDASSARILIGGGPDTGATLNVGNHTLTWVATSTTHTVIMSNGSNLTVGGTTTWDNISVRLAEPDRSVNNNGLQVFGTVQKNPVATGADLVAYSGFSASNYLEQPYNPDLDFGTGDFCVMGWVKGTDASGKLLVRHDGTSSADRIIIDVASGGYFRFYVDVASGLVTSTTLATTDTWTFVVGIRIGTTLYLYVNGVLNASVTNPVNGYDLSNSNAVLNIGQHPDLSDPYNGSLALWRISGTAPTAEQIKKIYEDEKVLFQENAKATLHGTSDAVTALAYDDTTELLHVGTSAGRSVFQGLRRVDNTTDAVGVAISASNGLVAED